MAAIDEAAAAFGLIVEHQPEEEIELWQEHVNAVSLFSALMTQWRIGQAGPTGLDYAAIPPAAQMLGIRGRSMRNAFRELQIMEGEALKWFFEQQQKR